MHYTSQRRVDANNKYDFFWIVGDRGNYGLYLRLNIAIDIIDLIDNIKGISIYRGAAGENMSGIFIVLNNNEDWELFIVLCKDLINIAESCKNEHLLLNRLNNRLHRWQRLLSKNHLHNMTESR